MTYGSSGRPMTTTEFIVHSLSQEILNGKIKSGTRLTQNEISKKFNVSQTPVREALKILTTEGLISFDSYKGAIVKGLCYKDAKEIYDLRILLEAKLIRDGFSKYSDECFKKASSIQKKIEQCKDLNEWAILNSEVGGRTFAIVENLISSAIPYVSISLMYKKEHIELSNTEHREILEAYKNKDLEKLVELSIKHTAKTREILEAAINNAL